MPRAGLSRAAGADGRLPPSRLAPRRSAPRAPRTRPARRQEKYDLAEFHLARALQINPGSSPLQCYYGMAMHEKALADGQRPVRALAVLERAIELDPHNPLARFQKARVLLSLEERQVRRAPRQSRAPPRGPPRRACG